VATGYWGVDVFGRRRFLGRGARCVGALVERVVDEDGVILGARVFVLHLGTGDLVPCGPVFDGRSRDARGSPDVAVVEAVSWCLGRGLRAFRRLGALVHSIESGCSDGITERGARRVRAERVVLQERYERSGG